ncbi:quinolinate synthase NadA [Candidatus Peregrinibacteria bacterium]|nr:quinolinate synthase NadA [Candidatus Peregrinibacteria bacterium]
MAKYQALIREILALKKKKHAIILAHNYQRPEIYEVADYVGDSLGLCEAAIASRAKRIIFCGVKFMAESAKILNPAKDVYLPALDAGCALADSINIETLRELKRKYPKAATVCYINSTAEIKAECNTICTSSNAVEVARKLKNKEIIMLPDKNLAKFVALQIRGKKIIPAKGVCPIHHNLGPEAIKRAKQEHPGAKLIVHPECQTNVLELADFIGSTSRMSDYAKKSGAKEFIVVTECGMINKMQEDAPEKKFYTVCSLCYDMKKITLERVRDALKYDQYKIEVEPDVAKKARAAFNKMFELTKLKAQKSKVKAAA